jgi:hypothetical protein
MITIKAGEAVLDFTLYPRHQIDAHHASEIREALKAGVEMPPIKVDRKSKRVTDGFHRIRAILALYGADHAMQAIDYPYKSEREMFQDAMRLNAAHGRNLTAYDRAHCVLRGQELGIKPATIAESLSITVERVESLLVEKTALNGKGVNRKQPDTIAIKRTIGHKAGQKLTKDQQEANKRLGGMNQLFYVNQLITLFEADLVDWENEDLKAAMAKLRDLLGAAKL